VLSEISPVIIGYSGYYYESIRQPYEVGNLPESKKLDIMKKRLEEESKKVKSTYNLKGKLVRHEGSDSSGKWLNLRV
jgi:hypothetical protein